MHELLFAKRQSQVRGCRRAQTKTGVSRLKKNVGFLDPKVWIINLLQLFRFELASLTVHSNYFEGNGVCCETVFVYN